jgi:predicted GIY-YIG superfamily endonuclease
MSWVVMGANGPLASSSDWRPGKDGRGREPGGCVYVISESPAGPVKIGVTDDANKRLSQLQTGNSRSLRLVKSWRFPTRQAADTAEVEIHEVAAPARWLKGEWFDYSESDVVALIEDYLREKKQ